MLLLLAYTLCRNEQVIDTATVLSSFTNFTEINGLADNGTLTLDFGQQNKPNLTFCDTPDLGNNLYQVKAVLASAAPSSAVVFSGDLNVLCVN